MPPIATNVAGRPGPRIIVYHQTHYDSSGRFVSVLPLLHNKTDTTHVIIAAVHLHVGAPWRIHLNNDAYDSPRLDVLWAECRTLQAGGIRVMAMLGGACPGSFPPLDGDADVFEAHYLPLAAMVRSRALDGLDLDVEERMSLPGIVRLIDRLKSDFGVGFLVTLAPVATALMPGNRRQLSGFSYFELEKAFARHIDWYNVQFYCGWASLENVDDFLAIVEAGFDASRVVVGVPTHPKWGKGWLPDDILAGTLGTIVEVFPALSGVMAWEYHESFTQREGEGRPWAWAGLMSEVLLKQESVYKIGV